MKVLLAIPALVLVTPVVLLVAIALGPVILVLLYIGGIALMVMALAWVIERATWHHSRSAREPSLHG